MVIGVRPLNKYVEYYKARDLIEDLLRQELIGPVFSDEIIEDRPDQTYSLGILWPPKSSVDSIEQGTEDSQMNLNLGDELEESPDLILDNLEDEYESTTGKILTTNIYKPSGLAITVFVPSSVDFIEVRFTGARYVSCLKQVIKPSKEDDGEDKIYDVKMYERSPKDTGLISLPVGTETVRIFPEKFPQLELSLFVRKIWGDGSRLVTICANNTASIPMDSFMAIAENAIFQSKLVINSSDGFNDLGEESRNEDLETQTLNLLYRNVDNFATGHGCAVKWNNPSENGKVYTIESEFLPKADLVPMEPREIDKDLRLDLKYWTTCLREEGLENLKILIKRYQEWLQELEDQAQNIRSYNDAIKNTFVNIKNSIERLENGIACLRSNDIAWRSFTLMNEAMLLQRINSGKMQNRVINEVEVAWYPFQLAYVLQIIPDIVEEDSEWQDVVDLLWYPTGGGKTEAYLALTAFTIFCRRLTLGEKGNGVTVLMRYTLRLLTAQQFERASALICACDNLRSKKNIPGGEISIGLWVGQSVSPNSIEDTITNLEKIRSGFKVKRSNPMQVFKCPSCAESLDVGCYTVRDDSLKIRCPNKECHFNSGLPIYVVDDDIYLKRPSLVLSTVDKFARIVWSDKTTAILGSDGLTPPPELIIQDELHLISGPLGSLTGLYESAVDMLCSHSGKKPKIIASTATARNAERQIKGLYNRDSFQFPPTGLDINDMFFAVLSTEEKRASRRYLGVCDTGNSMLDLLVRVYGGLFFAGNYLKCLGYPEEVIDQYYTAVGYFNSLRELGSSATVISDRVVAYANSLRLHKFSHLAEDVDMKEIEIGMHMELTSRRSTHEIKETLEYLEYAYPDERALSYILASNMLSVGIDISRLGLMTVYRQPKMNSEYIQATSRVGRSNPGLVISMYNNMSSRDKSHFEQFSYYHNTFYKHVEPTSVTPFSFRALEKGMHAVYVALVRHLIPEMRSNQGAAQYDKNHPKIRDIRRYLLERVEDVAPDSVGYAEHWLSEFEDLWTSIVEGGDSFAYTSGNESVSSITALLIAFEKDNISTIPSTLNSLRNVDGVSNVFILERE